jgi:response regulator RpfG family c-di-GMP phosphodiesterase
MNIEKWEVEQIKDTLRLLKNNVKTLQVEDTAIGRAVNRSYNIIKRVGEKYNLQEKDCR